LERYRHVIAREHHPTWEQGQRSVASPRCPLSCFTSFSDSCDVARRSLSTLLPARDAVEEVGVLSPPRHARILIISRLIDASCISELFAIRYINPQATRPSVLSRLGTFTVRGPYSAQVVPHPVPGWSTRVQVATHASQEQSVSYLWGVGLRHRAPNFLF
jgi:hypothetical protein